MTHPTDPEPEHPNDPVAPDDDTVRENPGEGPKSDPIPPEYWPPETPAEGDNA